MNAASLRFEIVVVGAGPAGIAAACTAAQSGKSVAIVDDTPWLGGQIWRGQQSRPSVPQAQAWLEKLRASKVTILSETSVVAALRPGVLLAERPDSSVELHWEKLILATGARELFLPFPGWTLPGVMGAGGLQALVKNGWPIQGQRVVIAGSGPLLLAVAEGVRKGGAKLVSLNEQAAWGSAMKFLPAMLLEPKKIWQGIQIKSQLLGVPHRHGVWPVHAEGDETLRRVSLTDGRRTWTEDCDVLACGFGLVPNVELPLALGCALQNDFVSVNERQQTSVENIFCAGEPTGIGGVDKALIEGQIAGYCAAGQFGLAENLFPQRARWQKFQKSLALAFALRPELKKLAADDTLVCRCEDVTLGSVKKFDGWRDAKLQTRCGMGACQGRICGATLKEILGWKMESVRPPVLPARVESFLLTGKSENPPT